MNQIDNTPEEYKAFINGREEFKNMIIFVIAVFTIIIIFLAGHFVEQRKLIKVLENKIQRDCETDFEYKNLKP